MYKKSDYVLKTEASQIPYMLHHLDCYRDCRGLFGHMSREAVNQLADMFRIEDNLTTTYMQ